MRACMLTNTVLTWLHGVEDSENGVHSRCVAFFFCLCETLVIQLVLCSHDINLDYNEP